MANSAIQKLEEYIEEHGWDKDDDNVMWELLYDSEILDITDRYMARWGEFYFQVVDFEGMAIGFGSAVTTGDQDFEGMGYEFDRKTVREMEPYEVTVTKYRNKE